MESARRAVKERIVRDMVGAVIDPIGGGWKVLVLDDLTTRVLSATVKLSDIQDCNVSVVEDLNKTREPMPLPALYFIQPNAASISRLVADFEDGRCLYPSAHIFFSSKAPAEAVDRIKSCRELVAVLKTLKESNLEFLTLDSRSLITDHPLAAVRLMGDRCEIDRREADREMESIVSRLSTVFATLNDFPSLRYKAGRVVAANDPPGATARSTLTGRLSARLHERLLSMQRAGQLPNRETCDLIVLDRSYDPVAPVIHEWTYEAMVYDLLEVEGNVFRLKTENQAGRVEEKEVLLEEHDELWLELRHAFIAEVYTALSSKFKDFQSRNKAAKLSAGLKEKADLTTGNIRALIQALPQFREFLSRLSLHIQVSSELRAATNQRQLTALGELEQDLVLGDKTQKDLLAFLQEHATPALDVSDKMRLFMCYLATHPGRLDATRRQQWQKVSKLGSGDMDAMSNLAYFGVSMTAAAPAESRGFFKSKLTRPPALTRKKRDDENGEGYRLAHFDPLLLELLQDVQAARLSAVEYPYVRPPQQPEDAPDTRPAASARTARSGLNWARRNATGEQAAAGGATGARRLVIFIIGGMTRSEMRIVHQMAHTMGRDIVIASTSVETPASFIDTLYKMGPSDSVNA